VKDNKDAIAQQIVSTGGQLEEVVKALDGWKPDNKEETPWVNDFKAYVFQSVCDSEHMTIQLFRALEEELRKLDKLNDESNFKKFLDHEDEQARIKIIFVRINEARIRFEVRTVTLFLSAYVVLMSLLCSSGCI
jgi:hypothetical protein